MSAPPYMKLYVADYLGDTHHLGALEHGAYLLLLMGMWRAGGTLPVADANLARLARCTPDEWEAIKDDILPFFTRSRGKLTHGRLTAELAKYESTSGKRSAAGKRGVAEKASKNKASGQAIASENESNCTHNQNQNQKIIAAAVTGARPIEADWPAGSATDHAEALALLNPKIDLQREPGFRTTVGEIFRWKAEGLSWGLDVVPQILAHAQRARASPARGWNYFTPAVRQSFANRTRPAEPLPPSQRHERPDAHSAKFDRHQANLDRALAGAESAARRRALEPSGGF